jgi:hypothetical protein
MRNLLGLTAVAVFSTAALTAPLWADAKPVQAFAEAAQVAAPQPATTGGAGS